MFGSDVIGIAVGLIFIYLILSLFVTVIGEFIASIWKFRSKNLLAGIKVMLESNASTKDGTAGTPDGEPSDDTLYNLFVEHGVFKILGGGEVQRKKSGNNKKGGKEDGKGKPSYLAGSTFSAVLIDVLSKSKDSGEVKAKIEGLPRGDTKDTLLMLYNDVDGDITAFKAKLENWFDTMMDRVSGWYKRKSKIVTFCIAAVVTMAVNADTIFIVNKLSSDPEARASLEKLATNLVESEDYQKAIGLDPEDGTATGDVQVTDSIVAEFKALLVRMDSVSNQLSKIESIVGIGWSKEVVCCKDGCCDCVLSWLIRIGGWLLTILAISLGAPFWFDILKRIINIRGAGAKPPVTSFGEEIKG
jgi:hypothetical protein